MSDSSRELTLNTLAVTRPPADFDLVRRVAAGDEAAFAELYDLYAPPVYNYLLRLVNESAVAEDILQEVFLALWRGARNFRAEAQVKTWLLRIAHHQAVSWLRRKRAVLWSDDELDQEAAVSLEDDLTGSWQIDQLRGALARLSPKHRAVIELTFVHGLSYLEIAQVMNCPIGTVKSRMSYALRHMNELLTQA
jgi:RNA polymerase sigma-70 factor, ECF subfamily